MPYYPGLRDLKGRCSFAAKKLIDLRGFLADPACITPRQTDSELRLATWNIRDFGGSKLNPRPRMPEALYFIAEILSNFDLIALQEVNRNLSEFNKMMRILGTDYDFIATDTAETDGGNEERMVFLYNRRRVKFRGIAGEVVLNKEAGSVLSRAQFVRTPFVVSFQAGWLKVDLCTVHLIFGEGDEGLKDRIAEIKAIGNFFKERSKKENANTILLGDFNIVDADHDTMKALESTGFKVADGIKNIATNQGEDKHYDQIAVYSPRNEVKQAAGGAAAGKVKFYDKVFDKESDYAGMVKTKTGKPMEFEKWRTWQMSDHYLLWTRLTTDFTDDYLNKLSKEAGEISTTVVSDTDAIK